MTSGDGDTRKKPSFATRLSHNGRPPHGTLGYVNPALHRGSTVLFPDVASRVSAGGKFFDQAWTYGLVGGPTHHALEDMVADIEGGTRCHIYPSGLAACTVPLMAFLSHGDHCLMVDSCYGPVRVFCENVLRRMGIEISYYAPGVSEAELTNLMRPNTRIVYAESPGSHTFEVQDVPMIARVAHAGGALAMMDNTWGFHFFQPFEHGVDVSIQALTKYAGGHSDILLGSVTTRDEDVWKRVRAEALAFGQYASADDCWLALRGLRTLNVRLRHQMEAGLVVARWLADHPKVRRVLHPGLPGAPGHELWKRDFSGACSLFGVEFDPRFKVEDTHRAIDAMKLFGIGASWGGFESLVLPTSGFVTRKAGAGTIEGPVFRLHIGLEATEDLIADLDQALDRV